jgi:hypothetical protein
MQPPARFNLCKGFTLEHARQTVKELRIRDKKISGKTDNSHAPDQIRIFYRKGAKTAKIFLLVPINYFQLLTVAQQHIVIRLVSIPRNVGVG